MDENLLPYKEDFYKECNIIDFFVKTLNEIKTQIEFYGYICEKDYNIFSQKADKYLKKIKILKSNLIQYKDEPSNLYLVEEQVIKGLHIYYSTYKKLYPDCLQSIKASVQPITQNLENTKRNILNHSISMLKLSLENNNKSDLKKYLKDTLEIVMINTFKGLFNLHQLILIYSKKKNNLYLTIKNTIEEKLNKEEINIVINDISERNYAERYKVIYEPIHFGNNVYKSLLSDESKDVMVLSKSILNYTNVFIRCIQIRKKIVKEIRAFTQILKKKTEDIVPKIKKICEKITKMTKKLTHSSPGTINSWNLVFSSWNSIYSANMGYLQFDEKICSSKLTKNIEECNEEYKTFEKKWKEYAEKIEELRKKYIKYSNIKGKKEENKEQTEENDEKKKREEKLKNYLTIDCTEFLDNHIPSIRDDELKRINEVKDLTDKYKNVIKKNLEEYLENTENEYDNAASIDLFEEIQNIFESQLESLDIKNVENYMDYLKEKISKIDFNDNLAENARMSLAEYYEHNDFDDEFDFSGGELENPFGPNVVRDDEDISNNGFNKLDEKKFLGDEIGGLKDEISSIALNNKNMGNDNSINNFDEINNELKSNNELKKNNKKQTPNFKENNLLNNQNININEFTNSEPTKIRNEKTNINNIIDTNSNNLKFARSGLHRDSKRKIDNLAGNTLCCLREGNIDINNEIDNVNIDPNDNIDNKNNIDLISNIKEEKVINSNHILNLHDSNSSDNINDKNIQKNELIQNNLNEQELQNKINQINNEFDQTFNINKSNNKVENNNLTKNNTIVNNKKEININNKKNKVQDKTTLHYGILGILGLFCLKSLFSSKTIFSADSFLNVVILGSITFIMYKTQFK